MNAITLFNHEEIGSVSTTGAESSIIPSFLQRLSPTPAAYAQSVARSFLLSADMGHAVHPNYVSKHEDNHAPKINGGVVIKTNAKQRYASDSIGSFVVKKLAERKDGQVQEFEVRNDMYVHILLGLAHIQLRRCLPAVWVKGRVARLLDRCYRSLAFGRSTSAGRCSPCTPSARQRGRTMLNMRSTSLARSSRALTSSTSRSPLSDAFPFRLIPGLNSFPASAKCTNINNL